MAFKRASVHGLLPQKVAAGSVQPASPRQPRWQASEHSVGSNAGDNIRMQARTFMLCAPFSSSQLLVLVVCAAATTDTKFMMPPPCTHSSSSGQR